MKKYIKNILEESLKDEVDVRDEWNRLLLNINKQEQAKPRIKNAYFKILTYVAAALIGFIVSVPIMKNFRDSSENVGLYQLITLKGEKSCLKLPDGSKVWINSCTTVEYDDHFGVSNRDIHLTGEAYFEVAKNKDIPFIVRTNEIQVRAVGTAFNVLAYPLDSHVITTLYEGKVAVNSNFGHGEILLSENQVAEFEKSVNKLIKRDYNEDVDAGWREGRIVFNMISLQDIATVLERKYNVSFLFENDKVKTLKFKGTFYDTDSLEDILNIVMLNTGIKCEFGKDKIIVE